jgi:hypothetical protein
MLPIHNGKGHWNWNRKRESVEAVQIFWLFDGLLKIEPKWCWSWVGDFQIDLQTISG